MSSRTVYKVKAHKGGVKAAHILIVEEVLGKELPVGVVVHHADGNSLNNSKTNLVVCQDRAYHNLLHQRMRALEACGNANWMKCPYCKQYDAKENMVPQLRYAPRKVNNPSFMHLACKKAYMSNYLKERML